MTPSTASPIRRMIAVIGRLRWWVAAAALLGAATAGAGIGLMAFAGALISRSAVVESTATLTLGIVAVRFFAVTRAVTRYAERYVGHLGTFAILTRLRVWFYRGIEPLTPAVLDSHRSGDLLSRIVDDVETLQDLPLRVLAPPVTAALTVAVGAAVLWWLEPRLAVVLVIGALLGAAVPWLTRGLSLEAAGQVVTNQGELAAVSVESVDAMADLIAYGRSDLITDRISEVTARQGSGERRLAATRGLSVGTAGLVTGAVALAALVLAALSVDTGGLDPLLLAVVPLVVIATLEPVASLAGTAESLDRSRRAAERLCTLIDTEAAVDESPRTAPADRYTGAGEVELDDVRVHNRSGAPDALEGLTFRIPAGSQVLLMGPSGSGKSTVAGLLMRFLAPSSGAVRLDGIDVATMPADETRAMISLVAQHDHLFDTTVRDNLRLGDPDADDRHLLRVCRAVALDGWLNRLPEGLDERVGEDGSRLSGGERQRLMIARALLAEAPVLVLDEATAHLDGPTERAVLEGIAQWRSRRTTIHIAHRRAAGLSCDLIIRLDPDLPGGCEVERSPQGR